MSGKTRRRDEKGRQTESVKGCIRPRLKTFVQILSRACAGNYFLYTVFGCCGGGARCVYSERNSRYR